MKVKLVVKHPDAFVVILKLIDFRNYSALFRKYMHYGWIDTDFLLKLKGEIDEGS